MKYMTCRIIMMKTPLLPYIGNFFWEKERKLKRGCSVVVTEKCDIINEAFAKGSNCLDFLNWYLLRKCPSYIKV